MKTARILAFSGSSRRESWNQKLVRLAARQAAEAGAEVTVLGLGDLDLPIFNEDLEKESGTPAGARRLKDMMFAHQGFLIACPEYNSSITPLLKNAIDWASRPAPGETPLQAFRGKVCGLMSASQGGLGGLRGLVHVRAILGNIGALVLPEQSAIGAIHEAMSADGNSLKEGPSKKFFDEMVARVVEMTGLLQQ